MSRLACWSRCCALVLASGLLLVSPGVSAAEKNPAENQPPVKKRKGEPREEKEKRPAGGKAALVGGAVSAAEAKILKALDSPTVIEFVETPLHDVVDYLKDYHHIEIQLDKRAFDESGIGTDTPITRNLREISLHSALDLLLDGHHLAWDIDHEVLLITTREAADARRETRLYNLAPLIGDDVADELAEVVRESVLSIDQREESADIAIIPYRHVLIVRHNPRGQRQVAQFLQQLQAALANK